MTNTGILYAVVDLSDDSTTVFNGPCLFHGATVTTAISAQACPIKDNTTTVSALAASSAIGTQVDGYGIRFETSLIVDPDNAATGIITVAYQPDFDGLAGNGA